MRNDPWQWSKDELAAYTAQEQARSGNVDLNTILKNLGRYDQGVVDEYNRKKEKKEKKDD